MMEDWKAQEEARMKGELESMRVSMLGEIDQLKKKEETYQEVNFMYCCLTPPLGIGYEGGRRLYKFGRTAFHRSDRRF